MSGSEQVGGATGHRILWISEGNVPPAVKHALIDPAFVLDERAVAADLEEGVARAMAAAADRTDLVVTAQGRLRWGVIAVPREQWMAVADLHLDRLS